MSSSKRKLKMSHLIFLLLLILLLVIIRWNWINQLSFPNPPTIQQGVLDLRGVELEHLPSFALDGEWLFYPKQWIGASNMALASDEQLLQVPGNWNESFTPLVNKAYGYGTYHLRILLDEPLSTPLSLRFQSIYTSSEVEINGEVLARLGILAEERGRQVSETRSFLVNLLQTNQSELNIYVRVANYESPLKGGIVQSIQFGTQEKITKIHLLSIGLQMIVCVIFLLHALYALITFLMDMRKKEFITFILMMVLAAMTIAVNYNELLFMWIDADFVWRVKLKAFASMWFSYLAL